MIIDQYLPKQSRVSTFIDNLNALAISAGLEGTELTGAETIHREEELGGEDTLVDQPRRVLVTFNYEGSFDEVYKLFEEINNYKQLLSVQSVEFSKRTKDWSVEIIIASYNLSQDTLDYVVENVMDVSRGKRIETIDQITLDQIKKKV